jgi:NADPH2:quinone reductase
MKAIQVEAFTTDVSQLKLVDVARPSPGPGQVLVKMIFSPINPSDFNFIRGDYQSALARVLWNRTNPEDTSSKPLAFEPSGQTLHASTPYIIGGEGVGIVEQSGGGFLAKRLLGKRVAISSGPPMGTWQEYTVVDAKRAVAVPDQLDDQQAAMYLVNPLSAYAMVKDVLNVQSDQWLMLSGAGSALSQMVIRMSRLYGFNTIAVVRSGHKTRQLKELGAKVVIETDSMDLTDEVYKATGGIGVDYVMDCIGGELLEQMQGCVTVNGHILVYGTLSGPSCTLYSRDLMMPCARISGFFAGNWLAQKSLLQKVMILRRIAQLAKTGLFNTPVDAVYSLDEYQQALEDASKAGRKGKILFKCK